MQRGSCITCLQAARMLLHKSVLPLIKDPGMQQSLAEGGWQQLPLGFQTGGELHPGPCLASMCCCAA